MVTRYETILKVLDLIDREREFTRRYIELNPTHADERKRDAQIAISAYHEVLAILAK